MTTKIKLPLPSMKRLSTKTIIGCAAALLASGGITATAQSLSQTGQKIWSLSVAETMANTSTTLSVRELQQGLYLLRYTNASGEVTVEKIVKQ